MPLLTVVSKTYRSGSDAIRHLWSWWALNPRPVAHKTTALTTELQDPEKLDSLPITYLYICVYVVAYTYVHHLVCISLRLHKPQR